LVKVALSSSKGYGEESKGAVRRAIELIGGIDKIVNRGDSVLIKPNLVVDRTGESGNVTHFSLVEALIELCYEAGASQIFVGDGSAHVETYEAFVASGMKDIVDKMRLDGIPVEFVDLNYDKNPNIGDFDAVNLGEYSLNKGFIYRVAHTVLEADVIISVAKLKNHNGAGITVALKNMIGVAPGGYYGFPKKQGNRDVLPHFSNDLWDSLSIYDLVWRTIIDLNRIVRGNYPGSTKKRRYLAVVDGVVRGAYDKRSKALPLWNPVKVGVIIAGTDAVAVDTVSAKIMCCRPDKIPTIFQAANSGLGTMSDIEITGEKVDDFRTFIPPTSNWVSIADISILQNLPKIFHLTLKKIAYESLVKLKLIGIARASGTRVRKKKG
jgi:uncharacterized protein (DUF362 family)